MKGKKPLKSGIGRTLDVGRLAVVLRVGVFVDVIASRVLPFRIFGGRLLGRQEDGVADAVRNSALVHEPGPELLLGVLLLFLVLLRKKAKAVILRKVGRFDTN